MIVRSISNCPQIYQAHPSRRAAAEPCMQLHPSRKGVGEPPDWDAALPLPSSARLAPGGTAALEAAWRLCERREALVSFLLRKRREASLLSAGVANAEPHQHWKASRGARRWQLPPADDAATAAADLERPLVERDLLALAAVLAGLPRDAVLSEPPGAAVAQLGELVGTPRDMSVRAAAQLRAALAVMGSSSGGRRG